MLKTFLKRAASKSGKYRRFFSVYSNQPIKYREKFLDKYIHYDSNIETYELYVQALLHRRWTRKEEVVPLPKKAAKIYIIDEGGVLEPLRRALDQQRLVDFKRLLRLDELKDREKKKKIDSQYIISVLCEENFKQLMDEYLAKVLVNGQVAPLKYEKPVSEIRAQVISLYLKFFYGDELSDFEKFVEQKYLSYKYVKFSRFLTTEKPKFKSVWTPSQNRRMNQMKNWVERDPNLYEDDRGVYEPLDIGRKNVFNKLACSKDSLYWKALNYIRESSLVNRKKRHTITVLDNILDRLDSYKNSGEFAKELPLPPDFHIEHSLENMHVWLLMNRLKQINTLKSNFMASAIDYHFKKYTYEKCSKIHLKRKTDFIRDLDNFSTKSRGAYHQHFNRNPITVRNPYYKIDALVWTTIYFEKVFRYADEVYKMGDYLVKHYQYISSLSLQDIETCCLNWDVFRVGLDYKQNILRHNKKPLERKDFETEMDSKGKSKKYYYSFEEKQEDVMLKSQLFDVSDNLFRRKQFMKIARGSARPGPKYAWASEKSSDKISVEEIRAKVFRIA